MVSLTGIRLESLIGRTSPAGLGAGVALLIGALVLAGFLVARAQVARHARDHFRDDAIKSAEQIAEGIERRQTDLPAAAAFIANSPSGSLNDVGAFLRDEGVRRLHARSIYLVGYWNRANGVAVDPVAPESSMSSPIVDAINPIRANPVEGVVRASEPIRQDGDGLIAFTYPVYERSTGELAGHVFAVHRLAELAAIAGAEIRLGHNILEQMGVQIADSGTPVASFLVNADKVQNRETPPDFDLLETAQADVGGRAWQLTLQADNNYALTEGDRSIQPIIVVGGTLASLGGGLATYAVVRRSRRFEAERSELLSRVSQVLRSAREGILLVDADRRVVWANESLARMFDISPPVDGMEERFAEIFRDAIMRGVDDPEGFLAQVEDVYRDQSMIEDAVEIELNGGRNRRILTRSSFPVTGPEGGYIGRLWMYRDVTDVRASQIAREDLIAMVSHDLRSPLTSVRSNLELLQDGAAGELTETQQMLVNSSTRSALRLQRMINDLLDQSLLEKGELRVALGPVDVAEAARTAFDPVAPQLLAKKLGWSSVIPEGIPRVRGDFDRLVQVLSNLLSNASRYTPDGGSVSLRAGEVGDRVQVTVTDTGPGISAAHQKRIFEPYYSVQEDSVRAAGSAGLGLAVAKALVELQGGEISVRSQPGAGATFVVALQKWSPPKEES